MTVPLTSNFFLNSRGLIFGDTASLTWALNKNTNTLSATVLSSTAATSLAGGAAGSLPYQSAANVTAFLGAGSNGSLLTLTAGIPAWEAVPTWNQNTTGTASNVTGVVAGANGGTGIANTGKTITIGGNLSFSGAFGFTGTLTNTTTVTFPTSGTLATTTQIPTVANSSATIGLARVNGATGNFMDAGSAPPLSQAIVPTWSGLHTFSAGAAVTAGNLTVGGGAAGWSGQFRNATLTSTTTGANIVLGLGVNTSGADVTLAFTDGVSFNAFISAHGGGLFLQPATAGTVTLQLLSGTSQFSTPIGVNGNAAPAQSTGWGTPTGGTVVSSFAAGATPSLLQMSEAVAQIITVMKQLGFFGA